MVRHTLKIILGHYALKSKSIFFFKYNSEAAIRRCSSKKGDLKNFAIFTGKLVLNFLLSKVTGLKARNFMKKKLQHRCFPLNIAKLLRTIVFISNTDSLHLKYIASTT